MSRAWPLAVVLAVLATSGRASAAAVPLSSLPRLPTIPNAEKGPQSPVRLAGAWLGKVEGTRVEVHAKGNLCIHERQAAPRTDLAAVQTAALGDELDFLRLEETDGSATLERTRVTVDAKGLLLVARHKVPLVKALSSPRWTTATFAYREGDDVVVLTTASSDVSVAMARRTDEDWRGGWSSCGFAMARLPIDRAARGGVVAQVFGGKTTRALPAGGPATASNFVVNLSLAKIGRDPEPFLSAGLRAD